MENDIRITKMSSRGQIVIPEDIRNEMEIGEGSTFVVFARKDAESILLKKLEMPEPVKAFEEIAKWGNEHAKTKKLDTSIEKILEKQHKKRK